MGQNSGCYFEREPIKKLIKPSVDYYLSSNTIPLLNGGYEQGHIFDLSAVPIEQGDYFIIKSAKPDRFWINDFDWSGDNYEALDLTYEPDSNPAYIRCDFLHVVDTFNITIQLYDSELNDYVEFFKIVK